MTPRVVEVPHAWGVGRVGTTAWPVSSADIDDETEIAVEHLRMLGLEPGGLVLIASRLAETIHVAPIESAAGRIGARWSSADATEGDAFRTASLIEQLAPTIVMGINEAVLTAIGGTDVFASVPVVAVTDRHAYDAIAGARWWLHLGPTSAFECPTRTGAHYDGTRWRAAATGDGIVVTNLVDRLTPAREFPTGIFGRVDEALCACGRATPRIIPT